mmetsp:Transcript_6146/g.17633  ORF Transcript_6146/g.17633 Transcript_6146/m.17633 type:complete len:81 (+) Transcript_6146:1586-1828(+)
MHPQMARTPHILQQDMTQHSQLSHPADRTPLSLSSVYKSCHVTCSLTHHVNHLTSPPDRPSCDRHIQSDQKALRLDRIGR